MSRIEKIEAEIQEMSPAELADFRAWFADFDADGWDQQFESDVLAGKLDDLAARALLDHADGSSTKLRPITQPPASGPLTTNCPWR